MDLRSAQRVLIIDEMNRANLPRVFGELPYLLEYRDETVDLLLREDFKLSPKLSIIGTMNTAVVLNCDTDGVSVWPVYRYPYDLISERAKNQEWSGKRI
jgi:MoxR-like ATPase